jgi:hypothetical protein
MQDLLFFQFTVSQNQSTGLIVGSVFYNLPNNAESISNRLTLLFFAVLFNALAASFEVSPSLKPSSMSFTKFSRSFLCTHHDPSS